MTDKGSKIRTKTSLLARGLDTTLATRLINEGYNVGILQTLSVEQLIKLGMSQGQAEAFTPFARPPIPEDTLIEVLYKSRWGCCLCQNRSKGIIIHHLTPWSVSKSHAEDNLVALCLDHHGEAHTKRELSLSLTPQRIRKVRDKWYEDAPEAAHQEAVKIARLIRNDHQLRSPHRGAMAWGSDEVAIFGNDGYGLIGEPAVNRFITRTRRQVELVRKMLKIETLQELAFATSDTGSTWVLLVRSDDVASLETLVWSCFIIALEEQTGEKYSL